MMVIRGNKRIADIYLGEFMRLHRHFAFREWVSTHPEEIAYPEHEYLDTTDTWWVPFFEDTKNARREPFSPEQDAYFAVQTIYYPGVTVAGIAGPLGLRDRWEYSHVVRAIFALLSLTALVLAMS